MSVELSQNLKDAIKVVVDGWYPEGPIDWDDFIDRVERYSDEDLGNNVLSPQIKAIKAHARKYRAGNA